MILPVIGSLSVRQCYSRTVTQTSCRKVFILLPPAQTCLFDVEDKWNVGMQGVGRGGALCAFNR